MYLVTLLRRDRYRRFIRITVVEMVICKSLQYTFICELNLTCIFLFYNLYILIFSPKTWILILELFEKETHKMMYIFCRFF